jgi:hypothetical protein
MPILSTIGAGSSKAFNPGALGITPGATTILDAAAYTSGATVTDLSGSGLNGALVGGVTKSSLNGGSFLFDGKSGYIRTGPVPNSGTAGTSWSMGVWVSPNTQWGNIVSMSDQEPTGNWQMPPLRINKQRLQGQVWQAPVQTQSAVFTMGSWYYVVLVWDSSTSQTRLYINGSVVSTNTGASYSASAANNYISLGRALNIAVQDTGWFTGYISHYHFYGAKALSNADVLSNYNLMSARHTGSTVSPVVTSNLGLYLDTNVFGSQNGSATWTGLDGAALSATGFPGGQLQTFPDLSSFGSVLPSSLTGGLVSPGGYGSGSAWSTASTSLLNTDIHTIMFWIKFNSSTAYPTGAYGNWEKIFGYNPAGTDRSPGIWRYPSFRKLHWRYDPGNSDADFSVLAMGGYDNPTGGEFELDTWYNVCVSKNGATATSYVNGIKLGTATVSNPKTSGNATINLMEGYTSSSAQMDGVMVYNRALSDAEVLQNHNALKGRYKASSVTNKKVFEIDFNNPASYPGSGTSVFETSGRQLTGSLTNTTYSATNGGSLSFNGSTSFMSFPYDSIHDVAGNGVTAEVWVKPASLNQSGFFIEKGQVNSQYSLFLAGTSLIFRTVTSVSGLTDISVASASFMNTTEWHHVVGTYSSGVKKLYINGVLISTQTNITGTINNNGNGIWLGKHAIPDSYFYNGSIAEARIYNRQLADGEVLYNFNATKARYNRTSTPAQAGATVTGGTALTPDATYYYRQFSTTDTLVVSGANLTADVLVVAGAGAGGSSAGGGGGAGGMIEAAGFTIPVGSHVVTIGAGGTATPTNGNGNPGNNTSVGSLLTANGGGRGTAWGGGTGSVHDGGSGGGGGAGPGPQIGGTKTQGSGTGYTGYGNNGGTGAGGGGQAGGGGGAGSAGTNGGAGSGRSNSYKGSAVTYAAGGVPGYTGIVSGTYASGGANTGNGGQGSTDNKTAGNGGSGVVVIRYARSQIVGG